MLLRNRAQRSIQPMRPYPIRNAVRMPGDESPPPASTDELDSDRDENREPMGSMPAPDDQLIQRLRATEQRATPQRLMILSVLQDAGCHLTADDVFQQLEPACPALNRSTVYRTLERFRDTGIVSETDLGGGVRVYEVLESHRHHHLICHRCNEMIDMDDDAVEAMRVLIRQRYGFHPQIDHLAIWGLCGICSAREND